MKRYLRLLLVTLFTVHCSLLITSAQTAEIARVAAAVKTMECDFVQTKQLKLLNDKLVSKGRMYYHQSDRLRWEYLSPYTYTFILNGNKILLKNARKSDVIDTNQNKIFREIARMMMSSVVGDCLSNEKDFKSSIATTPTEWVATLEPKRKDMRQMFRQIILHFNRSKSMVSCVELIEAKGDKTIIELKNVKTNAPIADTLFALD